MDPSIRVRMKRNVDLFSRFKKYIEKKDLFKILDYINSTRGNEDDETYGSVVIDYTESSFAGCKIQADLTTEQYYNLYDKVKSFKEIQIDASSRES